MTTLKDLLAELAKMLRLRADRHRTVAYGWVESQVRDNGEDVRPWAERKVAAGLAWADLLDAVTGRRQP